MPTTKPTRKCPRPIGVDITTDVDVQVHLLAAVDVKIPAALKSQLAVHPTVPEIELINSALVTLNVSLEGFDVGPRFAFGPKVLRHPTNQHFAAYFHTESLIVSSKFRRLATIPDEQSGLSDVANMTCRIRAISCAIIPIETNRNDLFIETN